MASGEPLACFGMITLEGAGGLYGTTAFAGSAIFGVPCIVLGFNHGRTFTTLFWTADGLSADEPSYSNPNA